jgi:hypothetical protein
MEENSCSHKAPKLFHRPVFYSPQSSARCILIRLRHLIRSRREVAYICLGRVVVNYEKDLNKFLLFKSSANTIYDWPV